MLLRGLQCSVCLKGYVWRVRFHEADDRYEWRAESDCDCDGGYGQPLLATFIRPEQVVIESGDMT
jgi:hypothetical protein